MVVQMISYTQYNPQLIPTTALNDLPYMWNGKGTDAENLIEFSGRLCYRSTPKMGDAPKFIHEKIKLGHEDIIEHVAATFEFCGTTEPREYLLANAHCQVTKLATNHWVVSANLRVWRDLTARGYAQKAIPMLHEIAPNIFPRGKGSILIHPARLTGTLGSLAPIKAGARTTTLIAANIPDISQKRQHGYATFLFEGISRTCTHQLVRHRLASYSQESQRYVDLAKGEWNAIIPPTIEKNPAALEIMQVAWQQAEESYKKLRDLGIRKEDARFLLPSAAETRIVVTMPLSAWSHFFWLRAVDKAAQWEIQNIAQDALKLITTLDPSLFTGQMLKYRSEFQKVP